jgi:predicted nucleotidyltransferase
MWYSAIMNSETKLSTSSIRQPMVGDIDFIAQKASPVFRKYGILKAALFGSRARGSGRVNSDIDVLFKPCPGMSLFDKVRAQQELEAIFGVQVDLVTDSALVGRMRPSVKRDLRVIYEGQ